MPSPLRTAVVTVLLLVFTNGPLFLVARQIFDRPGAWEDSIIQSTIVAAALVAGAMVLLDGHRMSGRRLSIPNPTAAFAAGAFGLVAVASTFWSVDSSLTSWRSLVYLALPLFAWVLADLDSGIRMPLACMIGLALGASMVTLVVWPDIGLDHNDDWRGIFTGRNSLAPIAGLGVVVGIRFFLEPDRRSRLTGAGLGASSLVLLVGAGSRTAWLALIVAASVATLPTLRPWLASRFGPRRAASTTLGLALSGVTVFAVAMSQLWGESTFEQRRTIWSLVWDKIQERPVHGHGFFAIWGIPEFISTHRLLERGSAHDSLLEVWLGIGLLGLVPFVVVVTLAGRNAARDVINAPGPDTWMWAAIVAFLLLENVTESFVLWFSYNWVILMAAAMRRPCSAPARTSAAPEHVAAAISDD